MTYLITLMLWTLNVWGGGDVKLFASIASVIPFGINSSFFNISPLLSFYPFSFTVMVNSILVSFPFLMFLLVYLINKTKVGMAMRAAAKDFETAQLMGISLNRTISFTFAVGSALAGIGSILYLCAYPQASPTMGSMLGLKAFVAAVLGGIGSIPGAMIGGILIGIIETFAKRYISPQFSDAVVFSVLIIILLVKPAGLLGKQVQEKV